MGVRNKNSTSVIMARLVNTHLFVHYCTVMVRMCSILDSKDTEIKREHLCSKEAQNQVKSYE